MKFEADRKALLDAVALVRGVIPAKTFRPILQNAHIETNDNRVIVRGTDMQGAVRIEVEKCEVSEDGAALVPAARLHKVLAEVLDEKVTVEVAENKMRILTARGKFRILGDKPEDFPAFPECDWDKAVKIGGADFAELVEKVAFASGGEGHTASSYRVGGVFVEIKDNKLVMVATDGKRMSFMSKPLQAEDAEGVIVPARFLRHVAANSAENEVALLVNGNDIAAKVIGGVIFVSRLVEGQFPDWRQFVLKDADKTLTIGSAEFAQLVKEGSLLNDEDSMAVRFDFSAGRMKLSSRSPDAGDAAVEAEANYEGGDLSIGFNPRFVLDALKAVGDEAKFKFKDSSGKAMLEGGGARHIVMPMEIPE